MKNLIKFFFLVIPMLWATSIYAQNNYLQKVEEYLRAGNCERAEKNYEAHKVAGGKRNADIERRIQECITLSITQQNSNFSVVEKGYSYTMICVQGGTFTMGCTSEQDGDCEEDEKPVHNVTLSTYYIGKFEVTQGLWKAVMGNNPSHFKADNLPVENVNFEDVQNFITQLNRLTGRIFRLPTEAEWEYAARGGQHSADTKYSGGYSLEGYGWYVGNSSSTTHPVGAKKANKLGIYDMSGNVWEWCNDWYGFYNSNSQINPTGPNSGFYRVVRGGSWSTIAQHCRLSDRNAYTSGDRYANVGFRLACSTN